MRWMIQVGKYSCVQTHPGCQWRWDNLCGCSLCPGVVPVCLSRQIYDIWSSLRFCMMTYSIIFLFVFVEAHLFFICASIPSFTHPHPQTFESLFWGFSVATKLFSTRLHWAGRDMIWIFRFTLSFEPGRSVYGPIQRSWAAKWITLVTVQSFCGSYWSSSIVVSYSAYIVPFTSL